MIVIAAIVVAVGAVIAITVATRSRSEVRPPLALMLLRHTAQISTADRREWIAAMLAECDSIDDELERRRFARSCVRGAFFVGAHDRPGRAVIAVVSAFVTGAAVVAVYGLTHYPELRTGGSWIVYLAAFIVGLVLYCVAGVYAAGLGSATARRIGLMCGLPALPFAWAAARYSGPGSVAVGMATLLLPAVAALGAIAVERDLGNAVAAVICCAVVAGLLAFIGLATMAYVMSGDHPSAELLREFLSSGARDYRSWIVGDDLGGACFMLLFVAAVGLPFGLFVARIATRERPNERPAVT